MSTQISNTSRFFRNLTASVAFGAALVLGGGSFAGECPSNKMVADGMEIGRAHV